MDTLSLIIKVLFRETRSEDVIASLLNTTESCSLADDVNAKRFCQRGVEVDWAKTIDQANAVYDVLCDKYAMPDESCHSLVFCNRFSVFNVLLHYSAQHVYQRNHEPVCRYEKLLSWHDITRDFGEDLFVVSFLASSDLCSGYCRQSYEWKNCISHDSEELNVVFSRQMMDLHAHLKGSSLNFDLNWISLMNHISGQGLALSRYDDNMLDKAVEYNIPNCRLPLYARLVIASAIRLYIYCKVNSIDDMANTVDGEIIKNILPCQSFLEMSEYVEGLQDTISLAAHLFGKKYQDIKSMQCGIPDYAINSTTSSNYSVLSGERSLMYGMFKRIYSDCANNRDATLFYAYLVIKEEFRRQFVQVNKIVGFSNFSDYECRKADFIPYGSIYDTLLVRLAMASLVNNDCGKRYMEVRVTPRLTSSENSKMLASIDDQIAFMNATDNLQIDREQYHYVFHFIKSKDVTLDELLPVCPRHTNLRKQIERQARAIRAFRSNGYANAHRLVGIDAANSEIYCRPEIFAQAFRYLSPCSPVNGEDKGLDDIGMTYHVGEDFYDIVDGLRAIDEVLKFMHFRNGCRLGHALVLGTDVTTYYESHEFRINATKQVMLDNIVWLYVNATRLGIFNSAMPYLKELFATYFRQIFVSGNQAMADIYTYYQSWLLRGDNPECYMCVVSADNTNNLKIVCDDTYLASIDSWNIVALNSDDAAKEARHNDDAMRLYYRYHYDESVKLIGRKGDVLRIKPSVRKDFMYIVSQVQQALLDKIERNHISIECNPSSNLKIGNFTRYDEHPIFKFYNQGLSTPHPRHDICVSINTDDAGVFATSLEREYSLLVLAMEKNNGENYVNTPRSIINWIENVRMMASEQVFKKSVSSH